MRLIWRYTFDPVLLKHKIRCRQICKMESAVPRHLLENTDFINKDAPEGSQTLCEGCEKRRDVARFKCLENGFQGGRLGAKRPVGKLWQQSSLHGT